VVEGRRGFDGSLVCPRRQTMSLPPRSGGLVFHPCWPKSHPQANASIFQQPAGTLDWRDKPDQALPNASGKLAFFDNSAELTTYFANKAGYDTNVKINTQSQRMRLATFTSVSGDSRPQGFSQEVEAASPASRLLGWHIRNRQHCFGVFADCPQ